MRSLSFVGAVIAASLLLPSSLLAGGPPRLSLPIDGVTPGAAAACAKLLTKELHDKIWRREGGVQLQQEGKQWFLSFYMDEEIRLSDVEAALEGSSFSVPRDRLRLFGHAILEIEPSTIERDRLLADLDALEFVSVAESQIKDDRLLVTLDMPYPVWSDADERTAAAWDEFRRNGLSSEQSNQSEPPATSRTLPSFDALRDVVAKHGARLRDVRWSNAYACRMLGCATPSDADDRISPVAAWAVGSWSIEFANGVIEKCQIADSGEASVSEPQRTSQGSISLESGSIVITFRDERVECWTPVGKRLVVEHWASRSQYPTESPVLGIAERLP